MSEEIKEAVPVENEEKKEKKTMRERLHGAIDAVFDVPGKIRGKGKKVVGTAVAAAGLAAGAYVLGKNGFPGTDDEPLELEPGVEFYPTPDEEPANNDMAPAEEADA